MKNVTLVKQLHSQFVKEWAEKMAAHILENPIDVIHHIANTLHEARNTESIRPLHVSKWLGQILGHSMRDAALRAFDIDDLLTYFDQLEDTESEPANLVEDSDVEWARLCAEREGIDWAETDNIPFSDPTIEYADGTKAWYKEGQLHREDGPAIEYANDDKHWYLNGQRHREDGPAIECADGYKYWYLNGQLHREDGLCDK